MRELNGRPIKQICQLCVIKHAVIKEPRNKPEPLEGVNRCDICEELGPKDVPQSVFDVQKFGGVRPQSFGPSGEVITFEQE